jgi:hypothetical protein
MERLKQIELLYHELKLEILKDVDILILRGGGNYASASIKIGCHPKTFYKQMLGECSFATALAIHKKISKAVEAGETFPRKAQTKGFAHFNSAHGRKKNVVTSEIEEDT